MDSDNSSEDPIYRFLLEKDDQEPDLDDGVRDMDGKTGLELNQDDFSQSQANQETLNGDHYYDVPGNLIESININIDVPKDTEAIELYQGQMNKIDSEFKHLKEIFYLDLNPSNRKILVFRSFKKYFKNDLLKVGQWSTHHKKGRMDHQMFILYLLDRMGALNQYPADPPIFAENKWMEVLYRLLSGQLHQAPQLALNLNLSKRPPSKQKGSNNSTEIEAISIEKPSAQYDLIIKIIDKYEIMLKEQEKYIIEENHPRYELLTEYGAKEEKTNKMWLFLKAVFQETAWTSNVSGKSLQSLLLFDQTSWLTTSLTTYLEQPEFSFEQYRQHQASIINKRKELNENSKDQLKIDLNRKKYTFIQGCHELLSLLNFTKDSLDENNENNSSK